MNDFEQIKSKIDIVDVVGRYVSLRRAGGALVGLCPFHGDKTPSFSVSQRLQKFRCWSCGESGDVVDFICKIENKGKKEAIETLLGGGSIVDIPQVKKVAENAKKDVCFLDGSFVERSRCDESNVLFRYLVRVFGRLRTLRAFELYRVGTTKTGGAIWWQIDTRGRVRSGKIMQYKEDGHRDKDTRTTWVHSTLKKQGLISEGFELSQCLFGEHILSLNNSDIVCIVEAEKTALIASILAPKQTWLAVGGATNLNEKRLQPIKHKKVVLYPDGDKIQEWTDRASTLKLHGYNITIAQRFAKIVEGRNDIADYLIESELQNPCNEAVFEQAKDDENFKTFVELFDIVLV